MTKVIIRKFFLSGILFFATFSSIAQIAEVTSFGLGWNDHWAEDGFIDTNGDRYICMRGVEIKLAKIDPLNQVIWVKNLTSEIPPTTLKSGGITKISEDNFLATYSVDYDQQHLVKFNSNGDVLFHKEVESSQFLSIRSLGSGDFIVGIVKNQNYFLIRYDSNGSQVWLKQIDPNGDWVANGEIYPLADGSSLAKCNLYLPSNPSKHLLIKFDSDGNILWEKCWSNQDKHEYLSGGMTELKNHDLVFVGSYQYGNHPDYTDIVVRKFNSDGDYLDGKTYGRAYKDLGFGIVSNDSNEMILVADSWEAPQCGRYFGVLKIAENLDLTWVKQYGETKFLGLTSNHVYKSSEDSLYFFGWGAAFSVFSNDVKLFHTDFNFDIDCNLILDNYSINVPESLVLFNNLSINYNSSPLILSETSLVVLDDSLNAAFACGPDVGNDEDPPSTANTIDYGLEQIRIFPNPASQVVNFSGEIKGTSISIYDASGRIIRTEEGGPFLDISDLHQGVYYLLIKRGQNTIRKSFVKK